MESSPGVGSCLPAVVEGDDGAVIIKTVENVRASRVFMLITVKNVRASRFRNFVALKNVRASFVFNLWIRTTLKRNRRRIS